MTIDDSTILIVDDEPNVISALVRVLSEEPYQVIGVNDGFRALAVMAQQTFKVVISDERMPGMDGPEFLALVKERYPQTLRIMLTGHASIDATMRAVNRGEIYRFFIKPWNEIELKLAIRSALEKYDLEFENRQLLRTVQRQREELGYLERHFPGISRLQRDEDGAIRLDLDASALDMADAANDCD